MRVMSRRGRSAAIFDFNGTLSDDEPVLFQIFGELFAQQWGYALGRAEYFGQLAGRSDREIIHTVAVQNLPGRPAAECEAVVTELLARRQGRYREIVAGSCPIRPGAQRCDVLHVLAHSPIPTAFAQIVTQEDVICGKPDPEGFLQAAAALGVEPPDVVVFEDSLVGIRAAHAARMRCIAVCGTHDEPTLRAVCAIVVAALSPTVLDLL